MLQKRMKLMEKNKYLCDGKLLLGIPPIIPSALEGFLPNWIGEFYAYYQWYNNIPSAEVINKVPLDYLKKAYPGLHDLDLELAVKKVS